MNRLLFFSGGLSSFAVAHWLKETYPEDNIVLYFTDTKWEDEDLYRFIYEVSDKLELPMVIQSMGIDPVQLMIKQKIIFNSRMGNCSTILKMRTAANFIKYGKVPKEHSIHNEHYLKDTEYTKDAILYFGIAFDEIHRTKSIKKNWLPFQSEFPLTKIFIDYDELLSKYDIKKPQLYLKGFTHNNCKGRCIKAGKKHFRLLYNEDRQSFEELVHIEKVLGEYIVAWHTYKNDEDKKEALEQNEIEMNKWYESKYTYKPKLQFVPIDVIKPSILKTTYLEDIKKQMDKKDQFDLFEEVGGCGCFVDYDGFDESFTIDLD